MAGFKFRLEAVLGLKKKIEDMRKRELAHLKELLAKEEDFLKELEEKRAVQQERLKDSQSGVLNINYLLHYYNYLNTMRERILEQISLIEALITGLEEKRKDLVAASKERKIIEKLKENQYKEFRTSMEKWETKVLDELATDGYTHRR